MAIPAFIINRNLLEWPKRMVEWMQRHPDLHPIIIDNNSDYPPLVEWYESRPCDIISLPVNAGHTALYNTGLIDNLASDYYILTDPDFYLETLPDDVIDKLKEGLEKHPDVHKAGLAIKIDDIPDGFPVKHLVQNEWENKFWDNPLGDDFYKAPIDTTFALYDMSRSRGHTFDAIRLGGPYTVRHLPFYITPETMDDELLYYFDHSDKQISTMARYLEPLIEEYRAKTQESTV
jgi:hypothetical protein